MYLIDRAVYPHNLDHIYPCVSSSQEIIARDLQSYPLFNLCTYTCYNIYLAVLLIPPRSIPQLTCLKITFRKAYTCGPILPSISVSTFLVQQHTLNGVYDSSSVDPAVYPCFNLYPAVDNGTNRTIGITHFFPSFPFLMPNLGSASEKYSLNPVLETQYPTFSLCKYSFCSIYHSKTVISLL